jgi:hypothetical protein
MDRDICIDTHGFKRSFTRCDCLRLCTGNDNYHNLLELSGARKNARHRQLSCRVRWVDKESCQCLCAFSCATSVYILHFHFQRRTDDEANFLFVGIFSQFLTIIFSHVWEEIFLLVYAGSYSLGSDKRHGMQVAAQTQWPLPEFCLKMEVQSWPISCHDATPYILACTFSLCSLQYTSSIIWSHQAAPAMVSTGRNRWGMIICAVSKIVRMASTLQIRK